MKLYVMLLVLHVRQSSCFDYDHVLSTQLPKVLWNETNQDKLKKDLFVNYDKHAQPYGQGSAIDVRLDVTVLHVESNEARSTMTFHALVQVIWDDPKLQWNKDDYEGIDELRVADHEIWHPDLFLCNSALGAEPVFRFGNPNALLQADSEVQIVLRAKQTVLCQFDLRHWPFDTQHCTLQYSSWVYSGDIVKYLLTSNKVNVDLNFPFSSWAVADSSGAVVVSNYKCCVEPYYRVNYNLTLVRNPDTYVAICVAPALVSTLLILLQFWLPPGAQSKSYINGFLLVIFIFHLLYFVEQIGWVSKRLPLIVLFYAYNLYMVAFAEAMDVLGIYSTRSKKLSFLESFVQNKIAKAVPAIFFTNQVKHEIDTKQSASERLLNDVKETPRQNQECYYLATFLNRVMFLFYLSTLCIAIVIFK